MIFPETSRRPSRTAARRRSTARALAASVTAVALGATALLAVAPAASAAEADLPVGAWVDQFDGVQLGGDWNVVNPVPSAWSLTTTPGSLTLSSQPGDTYQDANTAKNVFVVDVPAGDFTAVTKLTAPVSKDFQGAGLIAWKDMDNYVRSGLAHVGFAEGGPVVIENGLETAGVYGATFTARAGQVGETLKLQRTGDEIVTSYWDGVAWVEAASVNVPWTTTQVGLYALAAQDSSAHTATFDYFALQATPGEDVVPEGTFALNGSADYRYLVATDDGLSFVAQRPASTLGLVATEVSDGVVTLTEEATGRPVVVTDDRLALGAAGDDAAQLRLTDAGGGKLALTTADAEQFAGVRAEDGALVLGRREDAVELTLTALTSGDHALTVDTSGETVDMSDSLYGIFYEDINYAADGGLYAELVRNRSFEFNASDNGSFNGMTAWAKVDRGGATATTTVGTDAQRLNDTNRYYLTLAASGAGAGIRNNGYNTGLFVEEGQRYDFSVWARSATAQQLTVNVEDTAGGAVYATGAVAVDGSDVWKKYEVTVTATGTTSAGRLAVLAGAASTLRLDMVSLFPEDTWTGPVNGQYGLRKDLAEMIDAMDPSFLRFPGGCVTNVGTFNTYRGSDGVDRRRTYQWKETIGPVEERATNWNFWGYNQSYGIGYYEYFLFAEDLGATALPVVSVGANGCGSTIPEMKDDASIDRWVQDTLDLIEFANGDTSTEWGAVRAELGHPEPFGLKYIGLGNEENTTTFEANFPRFKDAIRAAYPEIQIISNSGPDDTGARFDTLWDFNREQGVDMVDEHYYNDPSWFLENADRYDDYDREGPHVFLGEYASKGNTFFNALSEAAYMTGIERNSDVVELASYAPLLANESYVQWSPDAIWFDNDEAWGSANYYVQKLFANNAGDQVVPSAHTGDAADTEGVDGGVFLSTWSTDASYDNVTVTDNASGDVLFEDDFEDASQWQPVAGTWTVKDGAYNQSSRSITDARSIIEGAYAKDWSSYTLELDATKNAGSEGFIVGFAASGANDYYWWNLGGWNNTRQALQRADGGAANEVDAVEGQRIVTGQKYHVKVVVEGSTIELYLDGELQMSYEQPTPDSLYQVVTRDEETGDLVVKVVNPTSSSARTAVTIEGDDVVAPEATITEMVGQPADTNTKADPDLVVPVERTWDGASNAFDYEFPAYSITFIRLAVEEAAEPVDLDVTARTQCLGGKAYLALRAINGEDVPVAVTLTSPFGTKSFASVAPDSSAYQSFNARRTVLEAGTATITGSVGTGEDARSASYDTEYPAIDCG